MECNEMSKCRVQVIDLDVKGVMQEIVANGQEDGFFVCDVSDIIEKYQKWRSAMPRIRPFYAVKSNDMRVVLETLVALGASFDCASQGEIMKVLSLGVSPDRIIFANPTKNPAQIRYARQIGLTKMTFDSEDELYKIKENFPRAELVIRVKFDDHKALYILGKKFGVESDVEAEKLLRLAKSLELNVIGVAFHIGSGSKNFKIYQEGIAYSKHIFSIASNVGYNFNLVDIGGGFPGQNDNVIFEIGKLINEALEENFPGQAVQIISEPGKYFVDSAFTLAACVHTTKTCHQTKESDKAKILKMYYTNLSVYQALGPALFCEFYLPRVLFDKHQSNILPSIFWGTTCDPRDKISERINLPELRRGDWVYFENTGAYTITLGSEFNGYPLPAIHSIIKNKDWLLLTKQVSNPIPEDQFVKNRDFKDVVIDLVNPYIMSNKYF